MTSCAKQFVPYPLRISIQLSVVWQSGERISQGDRYVGFSHAGGLFLASKGQVKIKGVGLSIRGRVPIGNLLGRTNFEQPYNGIVRIGWPSD